jgi:phospholipid-binding lipoprotein MlaA
MTKRLLVLFTVALLAGCATVPVTNSNPRDPWESFNRGVFEFNDELDKGLVRPAVSVYTTVIPPGFRTGITNFFSNVGDVWVGVNNFLQGKPDQGVSDFGRVLVNSTMGLGGLFDVASGMGLQHHNEDFGQTLGRWGVEPGPYLVVPVIGPRDVRDGFGFVVDIYGNPIHYMHDVRWRNSLWGLSFIDARANLNDAVNILDTAALDRYTFVRESYLQRRRNLVYDGDPPPLPPTRDDEDKAPEPAGKVNQPPDSPADAAAAEPPAAPVPDKVSATQPGDMGSAAQVTGAPLAASTANVDESTATVQPQARRVVYPVAVPSIPDRIIATSIEPGRAATTAPVEP